MTVRQALGIDIAQYARTGGTNFDRVRDFIQAGTYDFLIIKAGLGMQKNEIFDEQTRGAEQRQIPFSTYYFLDPSQDIEAQAQHYVNIVGAQQPQYIVDIEFLEEAGIPSKNQIERFVDKLVEITGKKPIIYSRVNVLEQIGFLKAAEQYDLWIAQYLFNTSVEPRRLYRRFDTFVRDHEWELPNAVSNTDLENRVVLWQFTKKGDGQHYIFNPTTNHPKYKKGKQSADLNISIAKREDFMEYMFAGAPLIITGGGDGFVEGEFPYPDITNQDIINIFHEVASSFSVHYWDDWIKPAGLEFMAVPSTNRTKTYKGPRIEDLPNLSDEAKAAILSRITNA